MSDAPLIDAMLRDEIRKMNAERKRLNLLNPPAGGAEEETPSPTSHTSAGGPRYDMPWADYYAVDALNASFLVDLINRTPRHALAARLTDHDTDAMLLGRAFHCLILEPDEFEKRYWTIGTKPAGKGSRKEMEGLKEAHEGQEFLDPKMFAKAQSMARAIRDHPRANGLLSLAGRSEVSIFWEMEGVKCKARIDRLTERFVLDLKSTRDAGEAFCFGRYGVFGLGYHIRAWFYRLGLMTLGVESDFKLIVCENEAPHAVRVFRFDGLVDQWAHDAIHRALPLYRKARETEQWPAYPDAETTIMLPPWMVGGLEA